MMNYTSLLIIILIILIICIYTCKSGLESNIEFAKYIPRRKESKDKQLIPRQIFQTHKDMDTVKKLKLDKLAKDLINKNPEYDYYFYSDDDSEEYIKNNFDDSIYGLYKRLKNPVARADFWRALIIYKEGGIYLDMDNGMRRPFNKLIKPDDQFVKGIIWIHPNSPNPQHIIISTPGHPIMKKMVDYIISSIVNNKPIMEVCGINKGWRLLEGYTGTPAMWKGLTEVIGTCNLKPGKYKDGVRLIKGWAHGGDMYTDTHYQKNLKQNKIPYWMENGDKYSDIFYY